MRMLFVIGVLVTATACGDDERELPLNEPLDGAVDAGAAEGGVDTEMDAAPPTGEDQDAASEDAGADGGMPSRGDDES